MLPIVLQATGEGSSERGTRANAALANPIEVFPTPNKEKVAREKKSQKKQTERSLYVEVDPSGTKRREPAE